MNAAERRPRRYAHFGIVKNSPAVRGEHSTESLMLECPPCRFQKRQALLRSDGEGQSSRCAIRTVDGEAGTLKSSTTWPSDQTVLHEGKNLELFTYLTPEPLVDGILGPFEQLGIPIWL
jgi:hypothetical protein